MDVDKPVTGDTPGDTTGDAKEAKEEIKEAKEAAKEAVVPPSGPGAKEEDAEPEAPAVVDLSKGGGLAAAAGEDGAAAIDNEAEALGSQLHEVAINKGGAAGGWGLG
jgi:hypothetical protein